MTGTSDEHKKWRSGVDRSLGAIEANVKIILTNQCAMTSACLKKHSGLDERIDTLEKSSAAERAVKRWKDRFLGGFLTLLGIVAGFLAKIFIEK